MRSCRQVSRGLLIEFRKRHGLRCSLSDAEEERRAVSCGFEERAGAFAG